MYEYRQADLGRRRLTGVCFPSALLARNLARRARMRDGEVRGQRIANTFGLRRVVQRRGIGCARRRLGPQDEQLGNKTRAGLGRNGLGLEGGNAPVDAAAAASALAPGQQWHDNGVHCLPWAPRCPGSVVVATSNDIGFHRQRWILQYARR